MDHTTEYTASDVRKILQKLFPHRRLVLSQFTFYNQCGVAKPTGNSYKRGRQCYKLMDLLPIATVLALKEEGIPLKNLESAPQMIQENLVRIFRTGPGTRLCGCGNSVSLVFPGDENAAPAEKFLQGDGGMPLFWSYAIGELAANLETTAFSGEIPGSQLPETVTAIAAA